MISKCPSLPSPTRSTMVKSPFSVIMAPFPSTTTSSFDWVGVASGVGEALVVGEGVGVSGVGDAEAVADGVGGVGEGVGLISGDVVGVGVGSTIFPRTYPRAPLTSMLCTV